MKKLHLLSPLALALAATFAVADPSAKTELKTVDAAGNAVTTESSDSTSTNLLGTTKSEHDSKVVHDPKGILNKTTETVHKETKVDSKGNRTTEVDTVDAQGTGRNTTVSEKTSGHWTDDGSTTKIKRSSLTDPKGLGNKKVTTSEEVIERNPDGSIAKHTIEKETN